MPGPADATGVCTDVVYCFPGELDDDDDAGRLARIGAWARRARRTSGVPVYRDDRLPPHTPRRSAE